MVFFQEHFSCTMATCIFNWLSYFIFIFLPLTKRLFLLKENLILTAFCSPRPDNYLSQLAKDSTNSMQRKLNSEVKLICHCLPE